MVIHFLHSYINPAHEERAAEIVAQMWPNGYLTVGHRIISEFREYERGVTASVNAAVQPVLQRYLSRLQSGLAARGYARDFLSCRATAARCRRATPRKTAVQTVMSGPASGVIAAAFTSTAAGVPNVITYDMGGTSTDVALIEDGRPLVSPELELEYAMPIRVPMVDVHTVGAGGGSIARVDAAGMLQVGPESAGASPGPICFGRGGDEPTITDAESRARAPEPERPDRRRQARFRRARACAAAGADREAARPRRRRRGRRHPAGRRRQDGGGAAHRLSGTRTRPARLRLLRFRRGGPAARDDAGAHARHPQGSHPARPGMTNALGCVVADLRRDFVRTINTPLDELPETLIRDVLGEHAAQGRKIIEDEQADVVEIEEVFTAGLQFKGQSHELSRERRRSAGRHRGAAQGLRRCLLEALPYAHARRPARCWSVSTPA